MDVPLDEAGGRGQESDRALSELSAYAETQPGLVGFGTAIGERITALRERAVTNAHQGSEELRGAADEERDVVQGEVGASHQQVKGTLRTARGQLQQSGGAAHGKLEQRADQARARSDAVSTEQTTRVGTVVEGGRQQARQVFADARGQIHTAGQSEGGRARDHALQQADHVLELGRQEAEHQRRTEEDADLASDKADAVMDVARDYAGRLRGDAHDLGSGLSDQAAEAQDQVSTEEQPTVEGLGQTADSSVKGIRELMGQVRAAIGSVALQGHQQLGAARGGVDKEVDNLEQAVDSRAQVLLAEGEAAVDAGLASGLIAHAKIAGQAGQLLDEAGRDAITSLTESAKAATEAAAERPVVARQPAPGGTGTLGPSTTASTGDKQRDAALTQLDQVGPGLDEAVSTQQGELTQAMSRAGTGAQEAGAAWSTEMDEATAQLCTTAQSGLDQVVDAAGTQGDAAVGEGTTRATAEADKVASDVNATLSDVHGQVKSGTDDAIAHLRDDADAGVRKANDQVAEVPGAMKDAADAQDSWLGKLGNWVSNQLSDVWNAVKGMADWKFIVTLAVGIGAALAVAAGVALLIASAPFTLPGLAVVLIVGAAAGAAGFAAAQIAGNLMDPNPNVHWYSGVGHAAIIGAFVGAGSAAAAFYGLSLAAGTMLVMGSAGVGTITANLATGRDWDEHLLANVLIIGVFHSIIKGVTDRIPSRSTRFLPNEEREQPPYEAPAGKPAADIVVDDPARIQLTDFEKVGDVYKALLIDQKTGASFGEAELKADAGGKPVGGPYLTIDPKRGAMPDGTPVRLTAPKGFGWTENSLRAALDAFRRKFGRGPSTMGGELAWSNLLNFQKEFAKIRAANPGLDEGVVAQRAVREISFGKHRIAIGYGDLSVEYGNMVDVTLPDGTVLKNVPKWVEVTAKPSTGTPIPTVPQRDDPDEEE